MNTNTYDFITNDELDLILNDEYVTVEGEETYGEIDNTKVQTGRYRLTHQRVFTKVGVFDLADLVAYNTAKNEDKVRGVINHI